MRSLFGRLGGALLILALVSPLTRADMIPGPPTPKREVEESDEGLPVYELAWGVVAVSMLASFAVLYAIRKRNAN
jgi:hypothetical protein